MHFKSLLSLALPLTALGAALSGYTDNDVGQQLAKRAPAEMDLHKRFSGPWRFFDVGLGACGIVSQPSDFVVALSVSKFGSGFPGPNCFRTIMLSYGGKMARAQVVDKCPGCPDDGLDLSRGLFRFFAPESVGVIMGGTWNYV